MAPTLTISGIGQVFRQDGGAWDIAGAFSLSGGACNFEGGTISRTVLLTAAVGFTNTIDGTITETGTLNVSGVTFANNGAVDPG